MFSVRGSLSSVSDVVQSSSFKARVSFSMVEVTLRRIYSTICLGISERIFLIEAVSMAIVPILVKVEGMVSII